MEVAPFRALTHSDLCSHKVLPQNRRNGGRPFQGIDTPGVDTLNAGTPFVEMEVAPFRALTQHAYKSKR